MGSRMVKSLTEARSKFSHKTKIKRGGVEFYEIRLRESTEIKDDRRPHITSPGYTVYMFWLRRYQK